MGKSKAFLLPICIDDTRDAAADVPDSFLTVQWTRLPGGETPPKFCERVKALLTGNVAQASPPASSPIAGGTPALPLKTSRRIPTPAWIVAAVVALVAVAIWWPWHPRTVAPPAAPPSAKGPAPTSEVASLRARLIPHAWKKEDFEPFAAALDRIVDADEQNADAWALRSIINSLQVLRNFEAGTKPLEAGRLAANRALHLAPNSGLAELAMGMHLTAMNSRGGEPRAARPHLLRALAVLPPDALTRYADVAWGINSFAFDELRKAIDDWLRAEPSANHAAFIRGMMHLCLREPAEALRWAERGTTEANISGIRSSVTAFEANYYLRADLSAARVALDRTSASAPTVHRALYSRWLLAMAEGRFEAALQELARTPETNLFDRYRGPKALLAGMAYHALGNATAARSQFQEAQRILETQLAADPQDEDLRADLALTLAYAGDTAQARRELSLIEPLIRGRGRHIRAGQLLTILAQTNAVLGQTEPLVHWLRELLSGPAITPFTPASLRIDPRFQNAIAKPEVQALLTEFVHLDALKSAPAATSASTTDPKSIAVLAFDNRSEDKSNDSFSDGMSEELLNVLQKVPGLTVKARNSSFYFKGRNATPQEIGAKLGVAHFVSGSVERMENNVRIIAQLSRTDNGDVMWSERFTGDLSKPWEL